MSADATPTMPDAPTPLDLDAIRDDLDASDRDLKKWVRLPVKRVDAVLAEIERLRAEVARLATRPAPAWDEEAVAEAFARALWAHGAGEAAYLVADLARMWDEGTLPQDPEAQHSVRVIRAQTAAALAVIRHHLPVKPDREAVARALREHGGWFADLPADEMDCCADAALALLPGRSEATVKAEAWNEAVDTLSRHWEDVAPTAVADLERRNPYRAGGAS